MEVAEASEDADGSRGAIERAQSDRGTVRSRAGKQRAAESKPLDERKRRACVRACVEGPDPESGVGRRKGHPRPAAAASSRRRRSLEARGGAMESRRHRKGRLKPSSHRREQMEGQACGGSHQTGGAVRKKGDCFSSGLTRHRVQAEGGPGRRQTGRGGGGPGKGECGLG